MIFNKAFNKVRDEEIEKIVFDVTHYATKILWQDVRTLNGIETEILYRCNSVTSEDVRLKDNTLVLIKYLNGEVQEVSIEV